MSHRLLYEVLSELAQRVQALNGQPGQAAESKEPFDLLELDKQIKRLAREVYKANTLSETHTEQNRAAVESARQALEALQKERQDQITQQREEIARQARLEVAKALLPVVDGIENGISSGALQIKGLLTTAPDSARILIGWLNGQRLLRERLLKLLEAEGVTPIPTVGQPFDPYRHVVVKTDADNTKAIGIILREEQRGYLYGNGVLRYAEVIVNKPTQQLAEGQG